MDTFIQIGSDLYIVGANDIQIFKNKIIPNVNTLFAKKTNISVMTSISSGQVIRVVEIDKLMELLFNSLNVNDNSCNNDPMLLIVKNRCTKKIYKIEFVNSRSIQIFNDQRFDIVCEMVKISSNKTLKKYNEIMGFSSENDFSKIAIMRTIFELDDIKDYKYLENILENDQKLSEMDIYKKIVKEIFESQMNELDKNFLKKYEILDESGNIIEKKFYLIKLMMLDLNPNLVIKMERRIGGAAYISIEQKK